MKSKQKGLNSNSEGEIYEKRGIYLEKSKNLNMPYICIIASGTNTAGKIEIKEVNIDNKNNVEITVLENLPERDSDCYFYSYTNL